MNTMRTIFYDYKANIDLRLPSRERLLKRLGEYDTLAEYTACAVLDFEANWTGEGDYSDYVTAKAVQHNVNLKGGVQLDNYMNALYKSFMVNSHAMFTDFIRQYRNDIKNLINPDFHLAESASDKSELDRLVISLKKEGIEPQWPDWLLQVINYYRIVRNKVAHNDKDNEECQDAYNEIDFEQLEKDYPTFSGLPNPNDGITIDDFYFYSACIKHVANYLVMALKGKVDWDHIGNIHSEFTKKWVKGTNPYALINRTLCAYNYHPTKEQVRNIIESIKERRENEN